MINPELFIDLPDDNEQAFIAIAADALSMLENAYAYCEANHEIPRYAERRFVADVMAAIREFEIDELKGWDPDGNDMPDRFADEVRQVINRLRIRQARRHKKYTVAFDAATKKKLHHYLRMIRQVVDNSSDTEWKKDALRACIAALAAEIDFGRAGYEKFTDLQVSLSGTVREVWENVSPMITSIMEIVGIAKRDEEAQSRLPAPSPRKRIEGPKEPDPSPSPNKQRLSNSFDRQTDDEIPF